jgi:hypothetical protein
MNSRYIVLYKAIYSTAVKASKISYITLLRPFIAFMWSDIHYIEKYFRQELYFDEIYISYYVFLLCNSP